MKKLLTIAVALFAGFAIAADGDDKGEKGKGKGGDAKGKGKGGQMFEKLDTNTDGSISKEEFAAGPMGKKLTEKGGQEAVDKAFGKLDADADGKVTKEEMAKAAAARKKGGKGKGGDSKGKGGDKGGDKKKKPAAE